MAPSQLRVCFLTHYFPPERGAPQTRIDLLARMLSRRGADVVVHTCFPHYPDGVIPAAYRKRPWLVEHRDGIKVVRSAVYPAANRGVAKRLADHTSFALTALATAWLTGPVDVVVAETPPLFTAGSGVAYAALKRAALVVNVSDRWPASAVELGMLRHRGAITAAEALESWIYAGADLITAPTAGIVEALRGPSESQEKIRRVWPVVDVGRFRGAPAPPSAGRRPLRLLYAGTIGLSQGLDVLVRASELAGPATVQTTIAGDGADAARIHSLVQEGAVSNVRLLGGLPAEEVPRLYEECDASVVLLRDLPIFDGALPTKLIEALAAGRPVVLSGRGESANLLERSAAGIVVPPEDPRALSQAIQSLSADPDLRAQFGRAGRRFADQHFGATRSAQEWEGRLNEAVRLREARRRNARRPVARDQGSNAPGCSSK